VSRSTRKLTVLVPVYFNAPTLEELARRLRDAEKTLGEIGVELELIFVDDGSKDQSLDVLGRIKSERPATVVIKLSRNFGVIAALKAGLKYMTGDAYIAVSADLQDPIELIVPMVRHWLDGAKFVICARNRRDDPAMTRLFAGTFYWFVRRMVFPHYPRRGFDLALLDRSLAVELRDTGKNVNGNMLAYWLGYEPVVIRYDRPAREIGRSRWSFAKRLILFIDSLVVFSPAPIRLLGGISLFVAVLAFVYALFMVMAAVVGDREVPGFATIVALIAFVGGMQLALLALIGEYIWRIYDDINRRPEAVIERVL